MRGRDVVADDARHLAFSNEDDATLSILAFRAQAMNELGMTEGALALIKERLRTKKRNPTLLRFARYIRGRAYENSGKAAMAKRDSPRT